MQKKAVFVCRTWFELIRGNSTLSDHLALHLPGRQARLIDDMRKCLVITKVSARNLNSILKTWSAIKSLEIPLCNMAAIKKLDLKSLKNLEKVTVNAKLP